MQETKIILPKVYERGLRSKKNYQIWYGGRGSAKSWTKAIQLLLKTLDASRYCRIIFARDTQKNVRISQFQLFKDIIRRYNLQSLFDVNETSMRITALSTGYFLIGGSFEQSDALRSVADPTDFWAEEPINRKREIGRDAFLDITGSLRNSEGVAPTFHFTFNPISKHSWIYKDFFEQRLYDAEIIFTTYKDNPFCPPELGQFLENLKYIDEARHKVDTLGEWGLGFHGLVYEDYLLYDEDVKPQAYGLDFGYNDPTALVALAVKDIEGDRKKHLFVKELLYKRHLTADDLVREVRRLEIPHNVQIVCDSARPEIIERLRREGYRAVSSAKGAGSVNAGILAVKEYRLQIHRKSVNLIEEIDNYVWDEDRAGALLDLPRPGDDHLLDAMRYGLQAIHKPIINLSI